MKITKKQLKKIIKEEKAQVLKEWFSDEHDPATGKRDQYEPENDPELYVNLSDDQLDALDALQHALEDCRASNVPIADIMDTVKAGTGA